MGKDVVVSYSVLKTQHSSMQYSDSKEQQYKDIRKLFKKGTRFPLKTGTEGGPETDLDEALKEFCREFNHALHFGRGNWIAIDREIIVPGSIRRNEVFVKSNKLVAGPGHDLVFPTVAFTHRDRRIGRIAQAAAHYATKGKVPGDPNYVTNNQYADKITAWMRQAGKGKAIAFVNGDFNRLDNVRAQDWAAGGPWTSMADELKAWQNTGHGPIDGFASFNKDGRVRAKKFEVLDDREFFLHTDHFVCRGTWNIRHLKGVSK